MNPIRLVRDAFGSFARALGMVPTGIAQGSVGYGAGGPVWLDAFRSKRPPDPAELVNQYKAVAFACVQLNANGVARVPLKLYAVTKQGQRRPGRGYRSISKPVDARTRGYLRGRKHLARALAGAEEVDEVHEHPFLEAIDSPNAYFDGNLLIQYLCRCLDVVGSAYLFPARPDPSYAASEWYPLHAQYVFPIKGTGAEVIRQYRYFGDTFARDDLVRIRFVSVRDPYMGAYAPLHACFEQLGLIDYYTAVVEDVMKDGARPSMVVGPTNPDRPFGEAERKRIELDINRKFGRGRQGYVWVTDGSFTATPMSYPPADLAGLEISKEARLLAANCFDVPISLLQAEDSNKATAQESTHQHQYYAIEPRCRMIASALTKYLCKPVDPRLFFEFDNPVERDKEQESRIVDMQVRNGTLLRSEARTDAGRDRYEGDDIPLVASLVAAPTKESLQAAQDAAKALPAPGVKPAAGDDQGDDQEPPEDAQRAAADAALHRPMKALLRKLNRTLDELNADRADAGPGDADAPGP